MSFSALSPGRRRFFTELIRDYRPKFDAFERGVLKSFVIRRWQQDHAKAQWQTLLEIRGHRSLDKLWQRGGSYGVGEQYEDGGRAEGWDFDAFMSSPDVWNAWKKVAEDFVKSGWSCFPAGSAPDFGRFGPTMFLDGRNVCRWLYVLQNAADIPWEIGCPREWEGAWTEVVRFNDRLKGNRFRIDSAEEAARSKQIEEYHRFQRMNSEYFLWGESRAELWDAYAREAVEGGRIAERLEMNPAAADVYPREDRAFIVWRRVEDVVRRTMEVLDAWREKLFIAEHDGTTSEDETRPAAANRSRPRKSGKDGGATPNRRRKSKFEKQKREELVERVVRQDDRFPTIEEVSKETGLTPSQVRETAAWKVRPKLPKVKFVEFNDAFHERAGSSECDAATDRYETFSTA